MLMHNWTDCSGSPKEQLTEKFAELSDVTLVSVPTDPNEPVKDETVQVNA
jgi:hypothetical protein